MNNREKMLTMGGFPDSSRFLRKIKTKDWQLNKCRHPQFSRWFLFMFSFLFHNAHSFTMGKRVKLILEAALKTHVEKDVWAGIWRSVKTGHTILACWRTCNPSLVWNRNSFSIDKGENENKKEKEIRFTFQNPDETSCKFTHLIFALPKPIRYKSRRLKADVYRPFPSSVFPILVVEIRSLSSQKYDDLVSEEVHCQLCDPKVFHDRPFRSLSPKN